MSYELSLLIKKCKSSFFFLITDWSNLIVGKLSSYLDLDHEDKFIRQQSEKLLEQELSFAGHLSLPAVMISLRKKNTNLARVLHNKVVTAPVNLVNINSHIHQGLNFCLLIFFFMPGSLSCLAAPANGLEWQ